MSEEEFRPLTAQERAELRRRTAKALKLLWHFQGYAVEVRQPHQCGCLLFDRVAGGVRCMRCMPPLDLPARLAQIVEESMR